MNNIYNVLLILLALSLLLANSPAQSSPAISIQTNYYPVNGFDSISIRQSIQQNGPAGEYGKHYHAKTQWKIKWSFRWIELRNHCRVNGVNVSIDIDYLLPQHQAFEDLSEPLKSKWDNYYQALFLHEQQHKDYGIQAAEELELALLDIEPQISCSRLKNLMTSTAQNVLDKYDRLEKEFDRITEHGSKQGVILP